MRGLIESTLIFLIGDAQAERMVPPTGYTVRLTVFAAAAMAFLATFALAFSMATGRLADKWTSDLSRSATIRIAASAEQALAQRDAVLAVLQTTPGVQSFRVIEAEEQQDLLAPWFGEALSLDLLPVPTLIEIVERPSGFDAQNLQFRLAAEAPGAVFDTHRRWRQPLVNAANRLKVMGWVALGLILATLAVVVTLAAQSALAANNQVIKVMRLIGARDSYIALAFVRRFTLRGLLGAVLGVVAGVIALLAMPAAGGPAGYLTGLAPSGASWLWPALIPLITAVIAFFATRRAARRTLRSLP